MKQGIEKVMQERSWIQEDTKINFFEGIKMQNVAVRVRFLFAHIILIVMYIICI